MVLVDQICGVIGETMAEFVANDIVGAEAIAEGSARAVPDRVGADAIIPVGSGDQRISRAIEAVSVETCTEQLVEIPCEIINGIDIGVSGGSAPLSSREYSRKSTTGSIIDLPVDRSMNRRPVIQQRSIDGIDQDMFWQRVG